jgi:hypothetical protein
MQEKLKYTFRLEGGTEALGQSRGLVWREGWATFFDTGLTGSGFLSKYGNSEDQTKIYGIKVPRYDWNTSDDPLNSLLLINRQIGLPGALIFLGLLYALWRAAITSVSELRPLTVAFFSFGVFTAFLNDNWLLSFGDSFDRFSYILFACALFPPLTAADFMAPPQVSPAHDLKNKTVNG